MQGSQGGVLAGEKALLVDVKISLSIMLNVLGLLAQSCCGQPEHGRLVYLAAAPVDLDSASKATSCDLNVLQGDITKLVDDIGASKPTLFIGVPRVFDRIYAGVYDKINAAGGLKKKIFNWAFKRKAHFIKAGFPVNEVGDSPCVVGWVLSMAVPGSNAGRDGPGSRLPVSDGTLGPAFWMSSCMAGMTSCRQLAATCHKKTVTCLHPCISVPSLQCQSKP